jgi:hypothetical protein
LEIGRINTLQVDRIDGKGAWLRAGGDRILLSKREVPADAVPGDRLEVFVYRGADGELTATLRRPRAQLGEFALLKVSKVTTVGAFLDWGLEKDLFVPFAEQPDRMLEGHRYLVRVCLDNLERLVGTAKIDRCLETEKIDLAEGEEVLLTIWEFTDLGAKVIINDLYCGLLYRDEISGRLRPGDRVKGYVKRLREDRKIDVTLRKSGAEGAEEAKATLAEALRRRGFLPLHDQSPPEAVREILGMSKKSFKKALGGLYKEGLVELTAEGIRYKKGKG